MFEDRVVKAPGERQLAALRASPALSTEDILAVAGKAGIRERDGIEVSRERAWLLTIAGISQGSAIRECPAFPSRTLVEYLWRAAPIVQVRSRGSSSRYRVMTVGGVVVMRSAVASRRGVALGRVPEEANLEQLPMETPGTFRVPAAQYSADPWEGMEPSRSRSESTRRTHERKAEKLETIALSVIGSAFGKAAAVPDPSPEPHETRAAEIASIFQDIVDKEEVFSPAGVRLFPGLEEARCYAGASSGKGSSSSWAGPSLAAPPGTNLSGAIMTDMKLPQPQLPGADFGGANLGATLVNGGCLSGASFGNVDLSGTEFRQTDLRGADLRATFPSHAVSVESCLLDGATAERAALSTWKITRCSFKKAHLSGAIFSPRPPAGGAGSPLEGNVFDGADLRGARISKCNLRDTSFRGSRLDGTDFRGSDLTGADLTGSTGISEALWEGAMLEGALMDRESRVIAALMGGLTGEGYPDSVGAGEARAKS